MRGQILDCPRRGGNSDSGARRRVGVRIRYGIQSWLQCQCRIDDGKALKLAVINVSPPGQIAQCFPCGRDRV